MFNFGTSEKSSTGSGSLFGTPSSSAATSSPSLFGSQTSANTSSPSTTTTTTQNAGFSFGNSAAGDQGKSDSRGSVVPSSSSGSASSGGGLFGVNDKTASTSSSTSGGLFGNTSSAPKQDNGPSSSAPQAVPSSQLFGGSEKQATTPSSGLFGGKTTEIKKDSPNSETKTNNENSSGNSLFGNKITTDGDSKPKGVTFAPSAGGGTPGTPPEKRVPMPIHVNWLALRQTIVYYLAQSIKQNHDSVVDSMSDNQVYDVKKLRELLNNTSSAKEGIQQLLAHFKRPSVASRESFDKMNCIPEQGETPLLRIPQDTGSDTGSSLRSFILDVSVALDLDELSAAQYVQVFLSNQLDNNASKMTAQKRIGDLKDRVRQQTNSADESRKQAMNSREEVIFNALEKATTFAELDVVEKVLHRRYTAGEDISKTLDEMMKKAEKQSPELTFGTDATPELLADICKRYHEERVNQLQCVLLIFRCACQDALEKDPSVDVPARGQDCVEVIRVLTHCAFELIRDGDFEQRILGQLSALLRVSSSAALPESKDGTHLLASLIPATPGKQLKSFGSNAANVHERFMAIHTRLWAHQCVVEQQLLLQIFSTVTTLEMLSSSANTSHQSSDKLPAALLLLRMLLIPSVSAEQHEGMKSDQYLHCRTIPRVLNGELFGMVSTNGQAHAQGLLSKLESLWLTCIIQQFQLDRLTQNPTFDEEFMFGRELPVEKSILESHPLFAKYNSDIFDFVYQEMHGIIRGICDSTSETCGSTSLQHALGTAWSAFLSLTVTLRASNFNDNATTDVTLFPGAQSPEGINLNKQLMNSGESPERGSIEYAKVAGSVISKTMFEMTFQQGIKRILSMLQFLDLHNHSHMTGPFDYVTLTDDDALYGRDGPLQDWDVFWAPWATVGEATTDSFEYASSNRKHGLKESSTRRGGSANMRLALSDNLDHRNKAGVPWIVRQTARHAIGSVIRAFDIMAGIELESDFEFIANLCAAGFNRDRFASRKVWRVEAPWSPAELERRATSTDWEDRQLIREEPVREVLINLRDQFPLQKQSLVRLCTSLVADEESARAAVQFLGCPAGAAPAVPRATKGSPVDTASLFSPADFRFARCTLPVSHDFVDQVGVDLSVRSPAIGLGLAAPDSQVKLRRSMHRFGGAISVPKGAHGYQPDSALGGTGAAESLLVTWELGASHAFSSWPVFIAELEELVEVAGTAGIEGLVEPARALTSAQAVTCLLGTLVKAFPDCAIMLAKHVSSERQKLEGALKAAHKWKRGVVTASTTLRGIIDLLVQIVVGPCGDPNLSLGTALRQASQSLVHTCLVTLTSLAEAEPLMVCAVVLANQGGLSVDSSRVTGGGLGANRLVQRVEEWMEKQEGNQGEHQIALEALRLFSVVLSYLQVDAIHVDVGFVFGSGKEKVSHDEFLEALCTLDHSVSLDESIRDQLLSTLDPNRTGLVSCRQFVRLLQEHEKNIPGTPAESKIGALVRFSVGKSAEAPSLLSRCLGRLKYSRDSLHRQAHLFIQHISKLASAVFHDFQNKRFVDRVDQWRLGIRSLRIIHMVLTDPMMKIAAENSSDSSAQPPPGDLDAPNSNERAGRWGLGDSNDLTHMAKQARSSILRDLLSNETLQAVLVNSMASLATSCFSTGNTRQGSLLPVRFDKGVLVHCRNRVEVSLRETLVLVALRVVLCLLETPPEEAWMTIGKVQLLSRSLHVPSQHQLRTASQVPAVVAVAAYLNYPVLKRNRGLGMPEGTVIPLLAMHVLSALTIAIENQRRTDVWRDWLLRVLDAENNDMEVLTLSSGQSSSRKRPVSYHHAGLAYSDEAGKSYVSLVALLGDHCEAISSSLADMLAQPHAPVALKQSVLTFVQNVLCFQPGFAAQLFMDSSQRKVKDDDTTKLGIILDQVLVLLRQGPKEAFSKSPVLHFASLGLLASLWWRGQPSGTQNGHGHSGAIGFGGLVNKIRLSPDFWQNVSQSLFVEVYNGNLESWIRNLKKAEFSREQLQLSNHIADHCFQLASRSWVLKIMTMELRTQGPENQENFHNLLKKLQREECDRLWLEQYQQLQVFPDATGRVLRAASELGLHPGCLGPRESLLRLTEDAIPSTLLSDVSGSSPGQSDHSVDNGTGSQLAFAGMQQDLVLDDYFQLFHCAFGGSYMHSVARLHALEGSCRNEVLVEPVIQSLRYLNCTMSLSDAQLELMHSWKEYMQTRCLIFWDHNTAPLDTEKVGRLGSLGGEGDLPPPSTPTLDKSGPVNQRASALPPHMKQYTAQAHKVPPPKGAAPVSLSPRGALAVNGEVGESKHWGDVTSYTLVCNLSLKLTQLLSGPKDLLDRDPREDAYICENSDLLVSMLHFRLFEQSPDAPETDSRRSLRFQKRPGVTRQYRMPLQGTPDQPGTVELIERVLACSSQVSSSLDLAVRARLREAKGRQSLERSLDPNMVRKASVAESLAVSLLTALLLLMETSDLEQGRQEPEVQSALAKIQELRARVIPFASRALSVSSINVAGLTGRPDGAIGGSPVSDKSANSLPRGPSGASWSPYSSQMFELSVSLLDLIMCQTQQHRRRVSQEDQKHANGGRSTAQSSTEQLYAKHGVFRILNKALAQLSAVAASDYRDKESLSLWLSTHNLLQMSIRVRRKANAHSAAQDDKQKVPLSLDAAIHNLGYDDKLKQMRRHKPAWYQQFAHKGGSSGSGVTATQFKDYNIAQLLFDHGVTSMAQLGTLNHARLHAMGIFKASDRRRLMQAIESDIQNIQAAKPDGGPKPPSFTAIDANCVGMQFPSARAVAAGILNDSKSSLSRAQGLLLQEITSPWSTGPTDGRPPSQQPRHTKKARHLGSAVPSSAGGHRQASGGSIPNFSRSAGRQHQAFQDGIFQRIELVLQFYFSATLSASTTAAVRQEIIHHKLVQALAQDPLMRAVSGDLSARPQDGLGLVRGYTVQGTRCRGHRAWCLVLALVTALLRSCRVAPISWEGTSATRAMANVTDQVLDFCMTHRNALLGAMSAHAAPTSAITAAGLDEAEAVAGLLCELSHHTARWRLRRPLFEPLVTASWKMLEDLSVGNDVTRRHGLMEEFGELHAKALSSPEVAMPVVPKLCIRAREVTPSEIQMGQHCAYVLGSGSPSGGHAGLGVISQLHVVMEHQIGRIVGHLLTLFSSRNIVKPRWMLESDVVSGKTLPVSQWSEAEIAFRATPTNSGCPSLATLVSVALYAKHRMQLVQLAEKGGIVQKCREVESTIDRWNALLPHLVEKALQLLTTSVELAQHERRRLGLDEFSADACHASIRRADSTTTVSGRRLKPQFQWEQEKGMKELKKKMFGNAENNFFESYQKVSSHQKDKERHENVVKGLQLRLQRCLHID